MGAITRIYGSIFCPLGSEGEARFKENLLQNLWALELLPRQDSYPPLTRNLFSVTACRYADPGFYREQTIHFGLTLKDLAESWDEWLDKFESLLKKLRFSTARDHLELDLVTTGEGKKQAFDYRWDSDGQSSNADETSWQFSGGPREFGNLVERHRQFHLEMQEQDKQGAAFTADSLQRWIRALARLRRHDEALEILQRLEQFEKTAAEAMPFGNL